MLKKAGLTREEQQQVLSATNAEYNAKKIETALKRLFKSITVTDRGRAAMRTRPGGKGKKFGGFKGAPKGGKKFGSYLAEIWDEYEAESVTDEAYYRENDEESEELDDMYENLADVAEDDEMMDEEDDYTDAMVAYQSSKKRIAVAKKDGKQVLLAQKGKEQANRTA